MKRLLAFLVLLGLGVAALLFAIGDDDAVRANVDLQPAEASRLRTNAPGIAVQQGKVGAAISQTGYLRFPRYRTIPQPDGSERQEEVFLLTAVDSQPIGEGRQQLDGVEVWLFDDGVHAATLVARQAFVELSRDANGRPSLREDKEIDLRDAVFTTMPGTKMAGLRLELGNAKVLVGEHDLQIRTANERDPVLLVVDGERQGTLRGNGLQARLPRGSSGGSQRADIEILHDPVLETEGAVVRAKGRMHYVENTATGTAIVTVDDEVQLDLARGDFALPGFAADGSARTTTGEKGSTAHGDQFVGWLLRSKPRLADGREHEDLAWRLLQLTGAPATVEVPGGRVVTPRITILPGLFGDPFLVTAHGGPSRVEQASIAAGSRQTDPVVGTSSRRIHLIQANQLAGTAHRSFGFPQWTLRPLQRLHVVAFEGNAQLADGTRVLDASRGLRVLTADGADDGVVHGLGTVRVEQRASKPGEQDLVATGNDGFWLRRTGSSQHLRLGPALPQDTDDPTAAWRSHRYEVRYGDAHVQGVGCCEVEATDQRARLWLRAPGAEIEARMAASKADLKGVRQLEATLEGEQLTALDVAGLPARTTMVRGTETVRAQAPRLVLVGPRSLRLLPVPDGPTRRLWVALSPEQAQPELLQTVVASPGKPAQWVSLAGPQIDIHDMGGTHVLVDAVAVGDWRPSVNAHIDNLDGREPTVVFCHAARLRLLPYLLTPEMRRAHSGGATGPVQDLAFHSLGRPWLLVDDVRDFQLDDERYGRIEGTGQRLLLSQGAQAALFIGDPESSTPAEVRRTHEDRIVTTRGARVRVFRDEDVRLQALRTFADRSTFLLPSVTLHEPGKDGLLSHMTAVCRGNIDVLPETVVFDGPVVAQGLREDGSEDPDGVHIEAQELRMFRQPKIGESDAPELRTSSQPRAGEIVRVVGRDVSLDWSKMNARSAEVELDLRWNRLIARDAEDAVVSFPDGRSWRSPFIAVNYDTLSVRWHRGRMVQQDKAQEVAR